MTTQVSGEDGVWRHAVPLPYLSLGHKKCKCGKKFLTMRSYEQHWRKTHG